MLLPWKHSSRDAYSYPAGITVEHSALGTFDNGTATKDTTVQAELVKAHRQETTAIAVVLMAVVIAREVSLAEATADVVEGVLFAGGIENHFSGAIFH